MNTLEDLFPESLSGKCIRRRELCGIPYPEVLQAIDIATAREIAVLGVELFQIEDSALRFVTGSGYEFPYVGPWDEFVQGNNIAARTFVMKNIREEGFVYILTSACRQEYQDLVAKEGRR
ncbi:MAG TPA: hypothetical protein VMR62_16415 [Bryobacteraceae bacterium]|jgi:hypothetical protein|nr:hypothetical protein [Bryobacteraceae bacterium]